MWWVTDSDAQATCLFALYYCKVKEEQMGKSLHQHILVCHLTHPWLLSLEPLHIALIRKNLKHLLSNYQPIIICVYIY